MVSTKYKDFIHTISENLITNPKKFWSLLASRTRNKCTPGHLKDGSEDISDPTLKAGVFNRFFSSIFVPWDREQLPHCTIHEDDNLREVRLEETDIRNALKSLDPTKAPGPDGIPTRVLKYCAEELIPNLTKLFNTSLLQGFVPQEWKEANVVPVLKKGDPTNPTNYRPISLLPTISKILASSSTTTQLLTFFGKINDILNNKTQCGIVYST